MPRHPTDISTYLVTIPAQTFVVEASSSAVARERALNEIDMWYGANADRIARVAHIRLTRRDP